MLTDTRQREILRRLRRQGDVSVQVLADEFGVSLSTIRRDLATLNSDGLLRRVRGGGSSVEQDSETFDTVDRRSADDKDAVADRAAALIEDGQIVCLDIGTTTARLARRLRDRRITVITSSLAVVDELRHAPGPELVVLGGVLRTTYQSLVGLLTEQALAQLSANLCFLSTSGVNASGQVLDTTGIEVGVKRAMLAAAERSVLLADKSKFPGTGLLSVCEPRDIDVLVTNSGADPGTLARMANAGTEVIEA
jgi:DeoR/GlpR family transcriptional regulator of sugar metabolism